MQGGTNRPVSAVGEVGRKVIHPVFGQVDLWRERHRFCSDAPSAMSPDEARFVLDEHSEHGPSCQQYLGALNRSSEVVS